MGKPLKRSLFGYSKSSVNLYIKDMNESASRMMEEKNTEIKRLREECTALREEKDAITEAIIAAKRRAEEITAASEREAEEKREQLRSDYAREKENIDKIRGWITDVKKIAAETLKRFEESLEDEESIAALKKQSAEPLKDGLLSGDSGKQSADKPQQSGEKTKPAIIKIK